MSTTIFPRSPCMYICSSNPINGRSMSTKKTKRWCLSITFLHLEWNSYFLRVKVCRRRRKCHIHGQYWNKILILLSTVNENDNLSHKRYLDCCCCCCCCVSSIIFIQRSKTPTFFFHLTIIINYLLCLSFPQLPVILSTYKRRLA